MICTRCGAEKHPEHSEMAPHGYVLGARTCTGYSPRWPCQNCGTDAEEHDPMPPHRRDSTACVGYVSGASLESPEPAAPFEGGGGSGGGGGASGTW